MDDTEILLEKLSNATGPSGFEGPVRSIMLKELQPLCDSIETDGMGSLISRFNTKNKAPKVMMAAHMDEVGLMVKFITPEGFIKFQPLGGWLDQALINQRWTILGKNGAVDGITGIKTPHVMSAESRTQIFKRDQIFIDIGATNKQDAEDRLGITPGDPIVPYSKFTFLNGNDLYLGKAWDDRAGLAVMVEVIKKLNKKSMPNNLYAVSTVQEEIGLRGAHTSSHKINPDIGINIESGVAGDYPGTTLDESQEKIGEGPAIFLHDASMLPNLKLKELVVAISKQNNIPLQFEVLNGYGEDGAEIQKSFDGVPTVNIAIPTRYLHSHYGVISRKDLDNTVNLVCELLKTLDEELIGKIKTFE
jgi:endoglucanase